jgi:hypothetical protein
MTYGERSFAMYRQSLIKGGQAGSRLIMVKGCAYFVKMEMFAPAIEDVFALKFDCSQPGREHLITRKRVSAVEAFNPRVSQIVEGMC